MKYLKKYVIYPLMCLLLVYGLLYAYSHFRYHRSVLATYVEWRMRMDDAKFYTAGGGAKEVLAKLAAREEKPFTYDAKDFDVPVEIQNYKGTQVVAFGKWGEATRVIMYLHGGAYIFQADPVHLRFCADLAKKLQAWVVMPLYPLAPNHQYKETYALLTDYLQFLIKRGPGDLTIMGDSAGGGLTLGLCEYLLKEKMSLPRKIVAISPWVDVGMTNKECKKYDEADPMLQTEGLPDIGRAWAGDTPLDHYQVSPMFGEVAGLPETLLFVGTREIIYPDVIKFYDKLQKAGVSSQLVVGEGMNHVYPLYAIPEAREALAIIKKTICGE